jgi:hypothetical protein
MALKHMIKRLAPIWLLKILVRLRGLAKGKWPIGLAKRSLLRSANSKDLSGKILRKMAFDRDPKLTMFADKYFVRDYVEQKVGSKFLNKLIAYGDSVELLRSLKLPTNFALKSNNGSGGMILVWENAPLENQLPKSRVRNVWSQHLVHPSNFQLDRAGGLAKHWLSNNYYFRLGQFPEWAYKNIKPMLLLEELMFDEEGLLPSDYKFFMANGKCLFIQVDTSRFDGHRRDLYTESWQKIPGSYQYPESSSNIARPRYLDEMLSVAKALATGVDFVRVDLYETNKGVKFGELTNYPGGGIEEFTPKSLDYEFGADWSQGY